MKKIIITTAVLAMAFCMFAMTGCGAGGSETGGNESTGEVTGTCTITIQDVCEDQQMDIHEGDTVFDILQATEVPVATEDTGNGISVEAINGQAREHEKGWLFYVNDEMPMDYCDKIQVNDGDVIVWEYSDGM